MPFCSHFLSTCVCTYVYAPPNFTLLYAICTLYRRCIAFAIDPFPWWSLIHTAGGCLNYLKQLIRNVYKISPENRCSIKIMDSIEMYGSKISHYSSFHTRFKARISLQNDWASLLLFLCYVYSLCQTKQCISSTIFRQERYLGTRSSTSQWKLRYYSRFKESGSKSTYTLSHTNNSN